MIVSGVRTGLEAAEKLKDSTVVVIVPEDLFVKECVILVNLRKIAGNGLLKRLDNFLKSDFTETEKSLVASTSRVAMIKIKEVPLVVLGTLTLLFND